MTTYTSNQNCFLIEGEVYFVDKQSLVNVKGVPELSKAQKTYKIRIGSIEVWYLQSGNLAFRITHCTKDLDNVVLLPRDKFVKPENVEELASKSYRNDPPKGNGRSTIDYIDGFKAGHNANTKKFKRDEMEAAFRSGFANSENINTPSELDDAFSCFINSMRPLSLPASLEINEQGEIVNIQWT